MGESLGVYLQENGYYLISYRKCEGEGRVTIFMLFYYKARGTSDDLSGFSDEFNEELRIVYAVVIYSFLTAMKFTLR